MIAQGVIVKDGQVLMVQQKTKRGAVVWNFPGGGVEEGETSEQACIREVQEETGYKVKVMDLLFSKETKHTYFCEIVSGELQIEDDEDILDVKWVDLYDDQYFDKVSFPIIHLIRT